MSDTEAFFYARHQCGGMTDMSPPYHTRSAAIKALKRMDDGGSADHSDCHYDIIMELRDYDHRGFLTEASRWKRITETP